MRYGTAFLSVALLALTACQPHSSSAPAISVAPATSSGSSGHSIHRVNSYTPPGVLKFEQQEMFRGMGADQGTIVALYPIKLEDGSPGHLIVVKGDRHDVLWSAAQPDVPEFTLHVGEQIIAARYGQYSRILPFKAPAPATGG